MGKQADYPFPRGWFLVALSDEVIQGKILSLTYFDQQMIAFRTETGRVVVLDAHCPHLGAHIGVGGKVEGECVRCPFHGWLYNAEGKCIEIPYSLTGRISDKAKLRAWPVEEKANGIFLWRDPENAPPDYHLPDIPQYDDINWIPWKMHTRTIRTHPREVIDNITDRAHFPVVHHSPVDRWKNEFDNHRAIQKQGAGHIETIATYHGPAFLLTELQLLQNNSNAIMLVCHTPIHENLLQVWSGVMVEMKGKQRNQEACEQAELYASFFNDGFLEDVVIWEHKANAPHPILCDGDGPIMQSRHWYEQFYKPRKQQA